MGGRIVITRVHTNANGEIIVQRRNVDSSSEQYGWRKACGPFMDKQAARQGELRYIKKVEMENPNRISQQLISKNWGEIKF